MLCLSVDEAYEKSLGERAVALGLLSPATLEECLQELRKRSATGGSASLGDLLIERRFVTPEGLVELIKTRKALPEADKTLQLTPPTSKPTKLTTIQSDADLPPEAAQAAFDSKNVYGKFVLVKELGRGGMGAVYKAYDVRIRRWAALKFLQSDTEPDEIKRFYREAEMAASLKHPNISAIYEVDELQGRHFIAMEYVEGKNLSQIQLTLKQAVQIMIEAARAVDFAHGKGIIHRDLKPQNIMVGKSGHPTILDFGLAKSLQSKGGLTSAGQILGTPSYMSPEQAEARLDLIDRRSDVYSLGATLYQLLCGRTPFQSKNVIELLHEIVQTAPRSTTEFARIPPELDAMILKCLEKDRDKRYPTAAALAGDLESWLRGKPAKENVPMEAAPAPPAPRSRAVPVLLILIVLGIGGYFGQQRYREYLSNQRKAEHRTHADDHRAKVEANLTEAHALLTDRKYAEAKAKMQLAVALNADDDEDVRDFPELFQEAAGKIAEAKKDFEAAIGAMVAEGDRLLNQKKLADALKLYQAAQMLLPEFPDLVKKVSDCERRINEAETVFDKEAQRKARALAKGPFDAGAAKLEEAQKETDPAKARAKSKEAVDLLTKAVNQDPTYTEAFRLRSRASLLRFDFKQAEADLTSALALEPKLASLLAERGELYLTQGIDHTLLQTVASQKDPVAEAMMKKANADLSQALLTRPIDEKTRLLAHAEKDFTETYYKKSSEALAALMASGTSSAGIFRLYAVSRHLEALKFPLLTNQEEAKKQTLQYLAKALELSPNDKETLKIRGTVRLMEGPASHAMARADLEQALSIDPDDAVLLILSGSLWNQAKDFKKALEVLDKACKLVPDSPFALTGRGWARLQSHQIPGAEEDFNRTLSLAPDFWWAYWGRGIVYENAKKYKEALDDYKKAVELEPKRTLALKPKIDQLQKRQ